LLLLAGSPITSDTTPSRLPAIIFPLSHSLCVADPSALAGVRQWNLVELEARLRLLSLDAVITLGIDHTGLEIKLDHCWAEQQ
jgi:hypothetical protein